MYQREKSSKRGPSLLNQSIGENYEFYRKLMEIGFSQVDLDRLKSDQQFAERALKFFNEGGITKLPDVEVQLEKVFGRDGYFGVRDWSRYFWVHLSELQYDHFPKFPWPFEIFDEPCPFYKGKAIKETHTVFLGLFADYGALGQFTVETLNHLINERGPAILDEFGNSLSMEILLEKLKVKMPSQESFRWYLMLTGSVPGTDDLLYAKQLKRLPEGYELPSAREVVLSKACFYTKVGRLHQPGDSTWIRCSDIPCPNPNDMGICVGRDLHQRIIVMGRDNRVNYHQNRISIYASRIPGQ